MQWLGTEADDYLSIFSCVSHYKLYSFRQLKFWTSLIEFIGWVT